MEKWVVAAKRADFQKIGEMFGIDPVITRLIRNRDIQEIDDIRMYLSGTLDDLPSPEQMKGISEALEILREKIQNKQKIRIIGDYDIDGVTSTYILLKALRKLGAKVDTYIPDRIADGYGMLRELIERACRDGVDTIVTCDNGISALEEIQLARKLGMTVIVTDHHEIPFEEKENRRIYRIPEADAVINPKQPDCPYPNKNICGAVVAWKLTQALYAAFGLSEKEYLEFLEFAAIATVGDVMDLQGENRIIVKKGLEKIAHTQNAGLKALIDANGLDGKAISGLTRHAKKFGVPVIAICGQIALGFDLEKSGLALATATSPENTPLLPSRNYKQELYDAAVKLFKNLLEKKS